jgi:hypothetical protein
MCNVTEVRLRFRKSVDSSSVKGVTSEIISVDAKASSYGWQALLSGLFFSRCVRGSIKARRRLWKKNIQIEHRSQLRMLIDIQQIFTVRSRERVRHLNTCFFFMTARIIKLSTLISFRVIKCHSLKMLL